MSFNLNSGKEIALGPRPIFLIRIVATDGDTVYLSSGSSLGLNSISYGGHTYQCRIQQQDIEAIVAMSPQGYDIPGSFRLVIADADFFYWTNHIKPHGWKGAILTVTQVLYDVPTNQFSTDSTIWEFILDNPEPPTNGFITVGSVTRASMTRLKVPSVLRQVRCGWVFPNTSAFRILGQSDPASIYYQCGYSPDVSGGVGNYQSGTTPFTDCDYTRDACKARGMFSTDSLSRATYRFGGDTWRAPVQYSGRQYTSSQKVFGFNTPNPPGNTFYPLVYGTQWVDCVVLSPALDPNTLRAECIVCIAADGPVNILKLLVNGVEIPQNNRDLNFNWLYISAGGRNGGITGGPIFDSNGDPHGSMAKIVFVVPVQLASSGVPSVKALVQGPPVATFASGSLTRSFAFSTNPVWHLVDLLTWGNWNYDQMDLQTFADAADFCDNPINYINAQGVTASHARFRSSFVLDASNRQSLAEAVLSLRNCANLMLARNASTGKLQCFVRQTLADQQGNPVAGSNYNTAVASKQADGTTLSGYLAYLFDGAGSIEKGTFKLSVRSMNDTPNRIAFGFQDEDNQWQNDNISEIDPDAYVASGNQEINVPLSVLGVPNFDQATRISNVQLSEAIRGNPRDDGGGTLYPEFTASMRALHLGSRVGLICGLTYEQLGL